MECVNFLPFIEGSDPHSHFHGGHDHLSSSLITERQEEDLKDCDPVKKSFLSL